MALWVHVADAQQPPVEVAPIAETLFRDGKRLMAEGKYAEACPKLRESQRLDPASGTLLNLALCHEAEGKTASAWAEFNETVELSTRDGREDRVTIAREHADAIEPRLSRLQIRVPPGAAVPGLEVRHNGAPLDPRAWDKAMPIDPGEHTIEATAPDRIPFRSLALVAAEGGVTEVVVPVLALVSPPRPPPAPPPPPAQPSTVRRNIAFAAGGVGVLGLGTATYLAVRTRSKQSEADALCATERCGSAAVALNHDAQAAADWATVSLCVGLAAVTTAVVLLVTAPSTRPRAAADVRGLRLVF